MYPQQSFVEPGLYGTPPIPEGMYQQPTKMYPQQPNPYPGMGQYPQQKGYPKMPNTGSVVGDGQYNLDARLDRIEREILEINRRLNTMTRQIRRIENFLNIREG